jgi:RIO kinase 1
MYREKNDDFDDSPGYAGEDEVDEASPLDQFIANGWITEVLHTVKSGKEATVYCCQADAATGAELVAAKVYREQHHRSFKNDSTYREGRVILDSRARRAFAKKTKFGRSFQAGSWLHGEYEALTMLHAAGADVPRPIASAESAILMEYIGDHDGAAQPLYGLQFEPDEAVRLFGQVMRNVELWLSLDRIHADLSPYNILYWQGRAVIIDFPQVVDPRFNPNARELLGRDIENVWRYFSRFGVRADPARITEHLWLRFKRSEL